MPFASALSLHPVASQAIGEVAGTVLETLGERPDLVVLCVTRPHAGALEDIAATVDAALHPLASVGCAAESVVATGTEVEEAAAINLWAGRVGPLFDVTIDASRLADDSWRFTGWPERIGFEPSALLLLCDPFTFPATEFLPRLEEWQPGLPVFGGNVTGGLGPGGSRLLSEGRVHHGGAAGVILGQGVEAELVVSQGCQPYGQLLTVTRSEGNVVWELAGKEALQCLVEQARSSLDATEIAGIGSNGLCLGRLIDERIADPEPADFLVRSVVGVDRSSGAIALDDRVPLGSTVRFCLRNAGTAHDELARMLDGRRAAGALAFVCNGRGSRLFGTMANDATTMEQTLGRVPVGGMFSAGEIGSIGGRSFILTNSASLALMHERRP